MAIRLIPDSEIRNSFSSSFSSSSSSSRCSRLTFAIRVPEPKVAPPTDHSSAWAKAKHRGRGRRRGSDIGFSLDPNTIKIASARIPSPYAYRDHYRRFLCSQRYRWDRLTPPTQTLGPSRKFSFRTNVALNARRHFFFRKLVRCTRGRCIIHGSTSRSRF